MKLSHLQEARYYQSLIVDIVRKITDELTATKNEEEHGQLIPPQLSNEQVIRDMDRVFDRAEPNYEAHDDDPVWLIKRLDNHENGVKIEATLYTDSARGPHIVVYKF